MVTLSLDDVSARFGSREVLSGITVPPIDGGALTAVVGPNAAGKSTLFRRIAGTLRGRGAVRVTGAHRGGVCYMPQDTSANAVLTVFESILLAARGGQGGMGVAEVQQPAGRGREPRAGQDRVESHWRKSSLARAV